jgi:hypothetical protein
MRPYGLRFSGDGSAIVVADSGNRRLCLFSVSDGRLVQLIAKGLDNPRDVEEVEGGWLVVCAFSQTVALVGDGCGDEESGEWPYLGEVEGRRGFGDGELWVPIALAVVPGLGLVVREARNACLQVFATPDTIAMASMSTIRVAWMVATARGALHRQHIAGVM